MSESTPNLASTVPHGRLIDGLPGAIVIRQFYLGCLSQASYLVGDRSTGRAIAVDPRRDVSELLAAAGDDGLSIELVVETHFHADFVSGHLELAAATGAEIAIGAAGSTEFSSRRLADGEIIDLGQVQIEVWSTPGHTPESISLVVYPQTGAEPAAVLTGDTLFIGDVGRPDLLVSADVPAEQLGSLLYDSVNRLAALPDDTLVLPGHGAGSACGRALSSETVSTIGEQRNTNYALAPMTRQQFVQIVTAGQPATPSYFGYDAKLNQYTRPLLDVHTPPAISLDDVVRAANDGAAIVDVRPTIDFAAGHLEGSIGIPLNGRFAEQAGSVLHPSTPLVLVGDGAAINEARIRLARIGYDRVLGVVDQIETVLAAHPQRARQLSRLTPAAFTERRRSLANELVVIDVRTPSEIEARPLPGAVNIPLANLTRELVALDRHQPTIVLCAGGARSAIAHSVLSAAGFDDVSDVLGGVNALITD